MAYKFTKLVPEGSSGGGGGGTGGNGFTFTIGADGDFSRGHQILYRTTAGIAEPGADINGWCTAHDGNGQVAYKNVVAVYYSMYSDGGFSSVNGKYAQIVYNSNWSVNYGYSEYVDRELTDGISLIILQSDLTINDAYNYH